MEQSSAGVPYSRIVSSRPTNDRMVGHIIKRVFDSTLATVLLIVCAPLMLVIALLVKLDTPGPVFFSHARVGSRRRTVRGQVVWDVREFRMMKFRSMVHNADQSLHQAYIKAFAEGRVDSAEEGNAFKLKSDPRITRVGRVIRKLSLDELPQLLNVIRGEMSLVGPRPVPPYEVAEYQPWHRERLAALPGITGMWQVYGRCLVTFDEMIRLDIAYVRNRSIWLDLKLLMLTIPAVISGRGAS
jgi:lipopolysaccharide/colanic/teichoic acid biosynthesis glycosyltransferase